ncbi:type IV pilin [Halostella litorea]|uniref:type IV pilin n=1 Tax=Halostella litorea TaxID=2528831 RepID=UPI0010920920|nr:type IV pilin N-terminal domain-containing protein [Halostella litorea]
MNIKTMFKADDDRAVSPVIGVILMVAITVILAAVIGAFVLDLGQGQDTNVNAGVSIEKVDSTTAKVQLTDMGNAEKVRVEPSTGSNQELNSVGDSETFGGLTEGSDTITVIAVDGDNENVIRNYDFE